jgi:hypothetical protein
MYLTTTTTPHWQHTDGSTRQATGTDHHYLGTCPNAARVSLYPPQKRTRVAGWTTVPLPHEPPALQSLLQGPKIAIVTQGWSRTPQPKRRGVSRVAWTACGRALSWSISTPRASFPVIQGQILSLLPQVSMFHLNNPFTFFQSVASCFLYETKDLPAPFFVTHKSLKSSPNVCRILRGHLRNVRPLLVTILTFSLPSSLS